MRVLVVGAGAYGLACAERLAGAGAEVTVLDSAEPGHGDAASGGRTRVLRLEYGSDARYSELVDRAIPVWRELEAWSGETLFEQRGVLHLADDEGAFERASHDVVAALGHPVELLDPGEIRRRWPAIAGDGITFALHSPSGGLLWAQKATRALARKAVAAGVELRFPARAVAVEPGTVVLEDGERLEADQVCLCTGSWSRALDARLRAVVPTRQTIAYFEGQAELPVYAEGLFFYGMPPHDGFGLKVARHDVSGAGEGDPADRAQRTAQQADLEPMREYVARRFPGFAGAAVQLTEVCFYALTADEHPILDRLDERTVACCGLSGHGYKFAPVLATAAADLVLGREPAIDIAGFEHTRPALS
jgi:glycine/D-amino acid oxidase-like deaminating enzyme